MSYRLPPLNAFRAFDAAARHLSFKDAAEELSVTPTAISHQIKGLEDFLGLALFRRLTRALELTPEGAAMLPKVREGLECFAAAIESTRGPPAHGRLIVVAPPSFASRWLVGRLQRFTQEKATLHILSSIDAIDSDLPNKVYGVESVDLREEDSQVVIRYGTGQYPGYRVDLIFVPEYVAVCSPKLPDPKFPLRQPADVRSYVLLHNDTINNEHAHPSWEEYMRLARGEGVETNVDTSAGPHFSDSGLAVAAAIDGLGIALASKQLVAAEIAAGRLIVPFALEMAKHYAYYLVTSEAISGRPAVEAFRAWLLKEAARDE